MPIQRVQTIPACRRDDNRGKGRRPDPSQAFRGCRRRCYRGAKPARDFMNMTTSHDGPPDVLDRDLELGPDDWQGRGFYFLLNALVIPRPIGWISTVSKAGILNLAPYSHFNLMGSNPFYLAFAS